MQVLALEAFKDGAHRQVLEDDKQLQGLEDDEQLQVLGDGEQVQALDDSTQVPVLEDGEQVQELEQDGSSREGANCLAVELTLPLCGHKGSEEGIIWGRDVVFSCSVNMYSVDNRINK